MDPKTLNCVKCGYDLRCTPLGGTCPECGTPVGELLRRLQRIAHDTSRHRLTMNVTVIAAMFASWLGLTTCFKTIVGPFGMDFALGTQLVVFTSPWWVAAGCALCIGCLIAAHRVIGELRWRIAVFTVALVVEIATAFFVLVVLTMPFFVVVHYG